MRRFRKSRSAGNPTHEQHDGRGVKEGARGVDGCLEVLCQPSIASNPREEPLDDPAKRADDPWAHRTEGQVADLKRRIPILKRLITDCDHLAADLEQEIRNEEDRVKIHDPVHFGYSIYARATASRRDNLRRSANELRAHLAGAEKALIELGETTLDACPPA
jgi:hypothetical protein